MPMRYIASLFLAMCLSTSAFAASDIFLISRGHYDEFIGSHKVQKTPRNGYRELRLCSQSYWVRPYSVAWTKWEEQLGHEVRLEVNQGYGWMVLCIRPTTQVSLRDVGIFASLEKTMEHGDPDKELTNRFKATRHTFVRRNDHTPQQADAEISRNYGNRASHLSRFLDYRNKN